MPICYKCYIVECFVWFIHFNCRLYYTLQIPNSCYDWCKCTERQCDNRRKEIAFVYIGHFDWNLDSNHNRRLYTALKFTYVFTDSRAHYTFVEEPFSPIKNVLLIDRYTCRLKKRYFTSSFAPNAEFFKFITLVLL